MVSDGQRSAGEQGAEARRQPPARRASTHRRRTRLVRGPLTIGEPAPAVEPRFAAADPYRPDSIADGGTVLGLTVRAASVRGLSKRYQGQPRQDDLCLRVDKPRRTLIAAVADGVSGAARSDLAAALVVRHAAAALARQLDDPSRELDGDPPAADADWREVFEQAAWALVEEHRRHAGEPEAGIEEAGASLATTLVVAAITPLEEGGARARLAAVGDSPAFIVRDRRFEPVFGSTQEGDGLLDPLVEALPRAVHTVIDRDVMLEPGSVLLICTDGLALPLAGGNGEVGATFARELRRPPDVIDFARLLDFSRSTYDDDRTAVAVWVPA
jgi:Protein phosphatase 2C